MSSTPDPWWPTAILALALLSDALMSIRPPAFIRDCLTGVRLPEDWWWTLVVIKLVASAGLLLGLEYGGIGFAANGAVICYFLCAGYAHYRAGFLKHEFWINCLGMLGLSVGVLVISYL